MDQPDSALIHHQRNINEKVSTDVISISSNICSDFCGFNESQNIGTPLKQKSNCLKDPENHKVDTMPNIHGKDDEGGINQASLVAASTNDAKKRFFVSEMELLPAEEIFEVNSNSTPDTLRRQRLERNKELKETLLKTMHMAEKIAKSGTFQKNIHAEDKSESSSEFPASSPSNTQLQKKVQQSQRPPLLKNTLPADAFERGLALITAQNPPMTVSDKIGTWQCGTVDQLSDVEDVVNFDETFNARAGSKKRLPIRSKTTVAGETYTTFAEFYKRIAKVRAPKTSLRGSDSKQKSKFTSEDDEKPTTSSCLARNRDTPLKKRPTKYKRAADLINEAQPPKKKSSSSGTQKNEMPNVKKKAPPLKRAATAIGNLAAKKATESSAASSHAQTKDNSKSSSARNSRSVRANQAKIAKATAIHSNLGKQIALTTTPTKEDQDAFFRWRRLSREIDKTSPLKPESEATDLTVSKPPSTGLIQIRYDFVGPNDSFKQEEELKKSNGYNVIVKTLNFENQKHNEYKDGDIFKTPFEPHKFKDTNSNPTALLHQQQQELNFGSIKENDEIIIKDMKPLSVFNMKMKSDDSDNKGKSSNTVSDFSAVEFHQQYEFCNYLGLTGMSTANAMANAAEELSRCNVARRSLRVRKIEYQKAKTYKQKTISKKVAANAIIPVLEIERPIVASTEQKELDTSSCKTMDNGSPAIGAEALETKTLQANDKVSIADLAPSEHLMRQTKDREAKIQILCQITASSKKEEEEACKKCVEQITEPIRRTLLEQCKQSGGSLKASTSKTKLDKIKSQRLLASVPFSPHLPSLSAPSPHPAIAETVNSTVSEITNFIDLTAKALDENGKEEVQTLHEKVQRCLEESRQNPPNIFIVKSLDNLKDNQDTIGNSEQQQQQQTLETIEKTESLLHEDVYELEDDEELEATDIPLSNLRLKAAVRNNKATQVNSAEAAKDKKRKGRTSGVRKTNLNLSGTRRLYTRSMLNLNQQRELRNRKVILKLLKTYSGLRIKVSQPKKKASEKLTEAANNATVANKKKNRGGHVGDREASIELIVSSEDTTVGDSKSAPLTTLFVNKILDSSSMNTIRHTSSTEGLGSTNDDSTVDTTNELSVKHSQLCETNVIFEYENLFAGESENMAAASSRTLTPKCILSAENYKPLNAKDKQADVAVQTDLANVTTALQPLCFEDITGMSAPSSAKRAKIGDNNDMDVVSSSDIVTSTTTHIGEHNRPALKHILKPNLVTKELYRNFSFTAESNGTGEAAPSQTSTASHLFAEINPLANVSVNSSATNINDFGIHALSKPCRALRNPLKLSDGPVLFMFYEDGLLIAVQEFLVSFWKYSRILNALTVKLHDAKCTNSCNSHELGTEDLQSSAATMGFRSSDLEQMSSMLVCGCEWFYLGERKRLTNDMEIESPYVSRLCFNDSRPVYVEMRCRELLNDFRECNLLSCYVNVYYFNEEEQVPCFHSIQLDTIQSAPIDVIYTTIFDSRYFVLAWPQANVLGKVRSGICKYSLTPELDMLATTRDFKAMRHALRSLECLKDGKLLGFGDSQLTVWDHRSGDVLMNYDLSMPLGRNLGSIYYQGLEEGQENVVVMLQHVRSEASSDLVVIACTISHTNPSRRVLQRHRLPTPAFYNICRGVNNGEHFVITAATDEEIWISCNDPRQLIFVPAQRSQRFYSTNRTTLVEFTHQTLTVDTFSNYLLKIAAGIRRAKKKLPLKANPAEDDKTNWTY